MGKVISVGGTVIKGIGTFTQAIGVMRGTVTSSSSAVNGLANILGKIVSPTGLAVTAIAAVTGAVIYFSTQQTEAQKKAKELGDSIAEAGKKLKDYNTNIDETAQKELSHVESVEKLKGELDKLVDENGKVKASDEGRAKFIVGQLKDALGIELELTDGQIKNYQDLRKEIDETIKKKKAEIQLNAEYEKYKNAIEQREQATKNLKETLSQLGMTYDEAKSKTEEYYKKMQDGNITIDDLKEGNIGLIASFSEADDQVKIHTDAIKKYEEDYAKFTEGKYDEIGKNVKDSTKDWTDTSLKTISDSIKEQKENLDKYKQINKAHNDEISKQNAENAQKELQNLTNELVARTSRVGELGKDEIEAWATLAMEDYKAFEEGIKSLDETTQKKLYAVAEVVKNDKSVANNMGILASSAETAFKSNDSKEWGEDMIQGMANGIRQKTRTALQSAVENAANVIKERLHFSKPDVGPLREYEKWMPDMVEGLSKTLKESTPKLTKEVDNLATDISSELNIGNSGSIKTSNSIDYNKMANAMLKALTGCKFTLDEDGFAKIVKDELYKVV